MQLDVSKETVWAATIDEKPGGLDAKLRALAEAGADLEFVIARRAEGAKGKGVVFVTPLDGAKQTRAARAAGFKVAESLHGLRVEGANRPGLGAKMTDALASAGLNLRGFSGAKIGRKSVINLAFDTAADATKARRVLEGLK